MPKNLSDKILRIAKKEARKPKYCICCNSNVSATIPSLYAKSVNELNKIII